MSSSGSILLCDDVRAACRDRGACWVGQYVESRTSGMNRGLWNSGLNIFCILSRGRDVRAFSDVLIRHVPYLFRISSSWLCRLAPFFLFLATCLTLVESFCVFSAPAHVRTHRHLIIRAKQGLPIVATSQPATCCNEGCVKLRC